VLNDITAKLAHSNTCFEIGILAFNMPSAAVSSSSSSSSSGSSSSANREKFVILQSIGIIGIKVRKKESR